MYTSSYRSNSYNQLNNLYQQGLAKNSDKSTHKTIEQENEKSSLDSAKYGNILQKNYTSVMDGIEKDFHNKGNPQYLSALKTVKKQLSAMDQEAYNKSVENQIQESRKQKKRTGPVTEAEVNHASQTINKNIRNNFQSKLIQEMRRNSGVSAQLNGKNRLIDYLA